MVPQALQEKPVLQSADAEIWNAFSRLSSRRPVSGMGAIGAIPYVEICAYLGQVLRLDDLEEFDLFVSVIDHLDQEFITDFIEKQEKERKASSSKKKPTSK